jgi:hypothetical protein
MSWLQYLTKKVSWFYLDRSPRAGITLVTGLLSFFIAEAIDKRYGTDFSKNLLIVGLLAFVLLAVLAAGYVTLAKKLERWSRRA